MPLTPASMFRLAVLMTGLLAGLVSPAAAQTMRFGVDASSTSRAIAEGLPVTYGSMWAGAWNQRWGWDGIRSQLAEAKASGVTPVIQWWYWGDDISPTCVEQGCWDARQDVQKDKATWYRMSRELADLVAATMGPGSGAVIIVETEFNKNGIETYEPFDGYLAEHASIFQGLGFAVVVGFGSWGQSLWPNFDRAVAAADLLGTMVLQSSVRNASTYLSGPDLLINNANQLRTMFGKPVFVTDFAFSSYPEPSYAVYQDTVIQSIFARMPELKAAGVQGMVWRMLSDDPAFDTSNYHGMAERFWGLLRADGSRKPGFTSFLNGMLAETSAPVAPPAEPAPGDTLAPAAPGGLTVTAGKRKLTLSWTASTDNVGVTGYQVWRSTSAGGPFTHEATTTALTYVNSGLTSRATYYYYVKANDAAGNVSAASITKGGQAR